MLRTLHKYRRQPALFLSLIVLVLILSFGLRMYRLAYDSIWWDEGFSVWMARMTFQEMLLATANDAHPPLYYALLNEWLEAVGDEEFSLRVLSVYFGLLTVALTYVIGRDIGGYQTGLAASLLAALARLPIWWSQEIRMYVPAAFFAALALWGALRLWGGYGRRWQAMALVAAGMGAGLLTLYLFAGAIIALNIAFVYAFAISQKRWQLALDWVIAQAIALAVFLPWVRYALGYLPSWASPQEPVTLFYVLALYLSTVFTGIATHIEQYSLLLVICFVILSGAALLAIPGRQQTSMQKMAWVALLAGVLLPPLFVYVLSLPRGQFNYPTPSPRYFVLLSTSVYILLGWGATRLNALGRHAGTALLAGLVALFIWSLAGYYPGLRLRDDYLSLVATLESMRQEGDAVVLNNDTDWPIFDYHYTGDFDRQISKTIAIKDDKIADTLLNPYRNRNAGLWIVQTQYAAVTDPHSILPEWMAQRSWNRQVYTFPEGQLLFYALNDQRGLPDIMRQSMRWPEGFISAEAAISDEVRLMGYVQPLPEIQAGNLLVIGLGYQIGDTRYGESWPVAIKIIGSDGNEIAASQVNLVTYPRASQYTPVEVFIPANADDPKAQIVFVSGERTWQPLGSLPIRPRTRTAGGAIPRSAHEADARFGDLISLEAVALPPATVYEPGDQVSVTFYWQGQRPIPDRYKVFVHIVGETYNPDNDGFIWGQQDQEPRNGEAITTAWLPGEIVEDSYRVPLQPDTPPGTYSLSVGFYRPEDGTRLPLNVEGQLGGDSYTIVQIQVK